ncbi:FtsK/SpoIIIE domain-containing protein [Sphingomonas sp. LR61]|uniref:FtsK/SpoIIIE domain-containing protein n=1 Tax=Sphingomonas sp. LR61 TaxID=3050234 RepID=UPI002FE2B4FD
MLNWRDFATAPPARPVRSDRATAATDLSVLVGAMTDARDRLGIGHLHSPWLPPLPELLPLDDVGTTAVGAGRTHAAVDGALRFPFGTEDLPDTQEQRAAEIDLDRFNHLFIVGAPGSGRSLALRTIAASAASSIPSTDLHLYAIDCGNGALASLQALPHCGAVVQRTQVERATRLIDRLSRETARRHDVIAAASASDITEQRLLAEPGERLPHVLVLVDRWENFTTSLGEVDGGALTDALQALLRDGAAAGIHIVVSGDRTLLSSRMSTLTDDKIVLRLTDRLDYSLGGINHRKLPATIPAGRGFRADSGIEVQFASLGSDVSGAGQTAAVRDLASSLRAGTAVPPSPATVPASTPCRRTWTSTGHSRSKSAPSLSPMVAVTGIGGDDMELQTVDLSTGGGTFIVAGPSRSGRSTMLASMARSLLAGGTELVVLAPRQGAGPRPRRAARGLRSVLRRRRHRGGPGPRPHGVRETNGPRRRRRRAPHRLHRREVAAGMGSSRHGQPAGAPTRRQHHGPRNRVRRLASRRQEEPSRCPPLPQDTLAGDLIGVRISRSSISNRIEPGTALVHLGTGLASTLQVPSVTANTRTGSEAVAFAER